MDEEKQLTSSERIQKKITDLKKETLDKSAMWKVITPENIEEEKNNIIENLNRYDFVEEAFLLEKDDSIIYVGKLIKSFLDENDEVQREFDFFITFSKKNPHVLTSYTDNELMSEMRSTSFSYALAINSIIGGKRNVYSSDIYRLIKEIKLQILNI
jgi:hypothetical protein